jgi:outer membrane receptor protein involved in Fe transport
MTRTARGWPSLLGASALSLPAGWAGAQAPPEPEPPDEPTEQTEPAEQPPRAGIETITVTSRRRAEDVQSVPIAVTAFSANDLAQQSGEGDPGSGLSRRVRDREGDTARPRDRLAPRYTPNWGEERRGGIDITYRLDSDSI